MKILHPHTDVKREKVKRALKHEMMKTVHKPIANEKEGHRPNSPRGDEMSARQIQERK